MFTVQGEKMWLNIITSSHWYEPQRPGCCTFASNFMTAAVLCTCWCRGHNYQDHNLNNPNTREEQIHKLTKKLYPLRGLSLCSKLAASLPSARPFTFSSLSTPVSTLSSVFLTSILDNFLMELRTELPQRRETYCFPCWDILSSYALRGGNVPHGATCWVTGQTNKHWELFIFYSHVHLIMEDVSTRTNKINNSTPPTTSEIWIDHFLFNLPLIGSN